MTWHTWDSQRPCPLQVAWCQEAEPVPSHFCRFPAVDLGRPLRHTGVRKFARDEAGGGLCV